MRALALPKAFVAALGSLIYPASCEGCAAPVEEPDYLCGPCADKVSRIRPPFCYRCSEPFAGAISEMFTCANCAHRTLHFDCAVAVFRSRGLVRKLVHEFKYGRQFHLRHPLTDWLAEAVTDSRLHGRPFDWLVPVPLHPARQRERGFNQAAALAEGLSTRIGVPVHEPLQRIRYTTTQTQFDRTERMENLRGAFRLRKSEAVRQSRVLLIDDVLTTGSTLSECARVLRAAGVESVHAATVARG